MLHYLSGDYIENLLKDAWEDVDPDELSYEELVALGEVVGTESTGLSADTIACLPSVKYKTGRNQLEAMVCHLPGGL
ncbi:hypothetical protein RJT34_10899 [Clitoria ternatea]|uniref:Uncharacterized protein n=1 Tax=Clitoria ternatea TaxID=43366 RepID=A0AAN9JLF3_CLITE